MIVVTGQTATGKTALALKLAKTHDGELVNFDSRQVYKYLDIITGKDLKPGQIRLYDVVEPDKYFSSYDFVRRAKKIIEEIMRRNKTPILVGGTYLYLKHLLYGFDVGAPPNFNLREKLNSKAVLELQKELKKIDPVTFEKMNYSDQRNPRRLIRKIEIETLRLAQGGKAVMANQFTLEGTNQDLPKIFIGLRFKNNKDLKQAITIRVERRLKQGAIDEVKWLLKKGYEETDPGLKTIGYRELINYLKGKASREEAIENWINHEVQYAKRQYTFMKKDKNITWRLV